MEKTGLSLVLLLLLLLRGFSRVRLCATPGPGTLQARALEWGAIAFSGVQSYKIEIDFLKFCVRSMSVIILAWHILKKG